MPSSNVIYILDPSITIHSVFILSVVEKDVIRIRIACPAVIFATVFSRLA